MANHMDAVKTTINVDEETMREFKKMTTSKYGSTRKLSAAIEDAMRSYNPASTLTEYAQREGITLAAYPSSREVEERRPKVEASAGMEVREMRDARETSIPRHE
jgi:metal-responsive CopG/Arc/MetJ family transcriptional regulator